MSAELASAELVAGLVELETRVRALEELAELLQTQSGPDPARLEQLRGGLGAKPRRGEVPDQLGLSAGGAHEWAVELRARHQAAQAQLERRRAG